MTVGIVLEWIGGVLVIAGALLMVVGAVGLIRMPDVFTRLHAASVSDTLGVSLVLVGLMFFAGFTLVTAKLAFIVLFLAFIGPVATHAVARAAVQAGVKPVDAAGKPLAVPDRKSEEASPSKR